MIRAEERRDARKARCGGLVGGRREPERPCELSRSLERALQRRCVAREPPGGLLLALRRERRATVEIGERCGGLARNLLPRETEPASTFLDLGELRAVQGNRERTLQSRRDAAERRARVHRGVDGLVQRDVTIRGRVEQFLDARELPHGLVERLALLDEAP